MNTEPWVPLSQRRGGSPGFEPVTGVPAFLQSAIDVWIRAQRTLTRDDVLLVGLAMRVDTARNLARFRADDSLILALGSRQLLRLDVLDWLLANADVDAESLRRILDAAGHEFTVAPDGKSLMLRIDQTMAEAFNTATGPEDAASELMARAWGLAFGLHPEPAQGWGEAVKALETVLAPIVSPNDSKATLGKMIRVLRDKPDAFACALPDRPFKAGGQESVKLGIEVLTDVLATIGYEPGRHGGDDASEADSGIACNVVFLATSVLAMLRSGCLTRTA